MFVDRSPCFHRKAPTLLAIAFAQLQGGTPGRELCRPVWATKIPPLRKYITSYGSREILPSRSVRERHWRGQQFEPWTPGNGSRFLTCLTSRLHFAHTASRQNTLRKGCVSRATFSYVRPIERMLWPRMLEWNGKSSGPLSPSWVSSRISAYRCGGHWLRRFRLAY